MKMPFIAALALAVSLSLSEGAYAQNIDRMKAIMDAVTSGDHSSLSAQDQRSLQSAQEASKVSSNLDALSQEVVEFTVDTADNFNKLYREAYIASVPPRDQEHARRVLLGDGTLPDSEGRLYYFVSRSMPTSLLRAYAVEALHTGATLVVKGLRRGDTVKEYVDEAITAYNSADGQVLAAMEINPNLFDMFGVEVVPTVVWTNRMGLEDIGAGCEKLPETIASPVVTLKGPDDESLTVPRPTCAQAPESSYYKIAGALSTHYVLDRFEEAGAPAQAMTQVRSRLADWHANVFDPNVQTHIGNAMPELLDPPSLDVMPRHVLESWEENLATMNVQRGPYGPAFSVDEGEDPAYREELERKVRHGLGLWSRMSPAQK